MTHPAKTSIPAKLISWLIDRDQRFRASRTLAGLPDERLDDMGMTRADARLAFRSQPVHRMADDTTLALRRLV
jgi:uncharacterized protein YjiS (DUF1127 family)